MASLVPVSQAHRRALNGFRGNFGLYFNKYIPITWPTAEQKESPYKASDDTGDSKNAPNFYLRKYNELKDQVNDRLGAVHTLQKGALESLSRTDGGLPVELKARLVSPLILGLGLEHPSETGLCLDHCLGIPYIPSSSLKGVLRLAYTVANVPEELRQLDTIDDVAVPGVTEVFGQLDRAGNLMVLDAYPTRVPELKLDVMTPHYGHYYQNRQWPSDTGFPVPVKFLAVKPGVEFVFRMLVRGESRKYLDAIRTALRSVLREYGLGGKTNAGYGLFEVLS